MSSGKPPPSWSPIYVLLYPQLAIAARRLGYALCVHGSVVRDLDLVAVPWTDSAAAAAQLALELAGVLETELVSTDPVARPHGRLTWTLPLIDRSFVDLSVMPRA